MNGGPTRLPAEARQHRARSSTRTARSSRLTVVYDSGPPARRPVPRADRARGGQLIVTRFAPSPTGRLHLGHAYSALFAWRQARDAGGKFLLRIEDIDRARCREEFVAGIEEDLRWLGIDWDGEMRRQSEHFADYRAALRSARRARRALSLFLHPRRYRPRGLGPARRRPGLSRHLPPPIRRGAAAPHRDRAHAYALRLDVERAFDRTGPLEWIDEGLGTVEANPLSLGDVVLARKDTPASLPPRRYGRRRDSGRDAGDARQRSFPATHIHRLLQALLDLPVPRWHHHKLLTDDDRQALRQARPRHDAARNARAGHDAGGSCVP